MAAFLETRYILLGFLVLYQVFVSALVVRSSYYSQRQKAIQLVLIWLIPFFAAATCHAVVASTRRPVRGDDPNFVRDDSVNPPGMGP
jgi:hypothetical protein